jgi:hypothetical protein
VREERKSLVGFVVEGLLGAAEDVEQMAVVADLLRGEMKECYGSQVLRSDEYLQKTDHCGRKPQILVFHFVNLETAPRRD